MSSSSLQPDLPRFVAIGEALTDLVKVGEDQWISKVGGATWNVARVVAKLGLRSAFAGAISKDIFGDSLWQASKDSDLDLRFLQQVDKSPLLAIVHETQPPRYFFVGDDSADLYFQPQVLPSGWLKAVEWAHFGGISLARQPLADRLIALATELKNSGISISYDPNFREIMDHTYDSTLRTMAQLANVIKISDEDLSGLFRTHDVESALNTLRNWNPNAVYLYTQGAAGASILLQTQTWKMSSPKIKVIDSVGAGDASIGGLLYSLMSNTQYDWESHLRFAIASGAAACLAAGATPPDIDTVQQLFLA